MEPDILDTAALHASLEAARAEVRALESEVGRAAKRVEIAQQARTTAEIERSRMFVALSAVQAECHAVVADKSASDAERALARRILAASRKRS